MHEIEGFLSAVKGRQQHAVVVSAFSILALICVVLFLRWLVARSIRRNAQLPQDIRRRWLVQIRNAAFMLILLGLIVIWAEELRLFAVSLLAVAVATVIALKELIQCVSGSVLKAASRTFTIGDRIEVANLRGDVIDTNALTTTILEIGPNELTQQLTGRAIVIPNSFFLDRPVINESFTDEFVLHVFKVPVDAADWQAAESDMRAAAAAECEQYLEEARTHFSKLNEYDGLFTMAVEPRVTFAIPKSGELELIVRIPVPARKKGRIEQAILRRFLSARTQRQSEEATCVATDSPSSDDGADNRT